MIVNCKYCNRPCRKSAYDRFSFSHLPTFQCDYHGATVVRYIQEPSPTEWYITFLVFYYKEQPYQATFYYNDPPYFGNQKFQVEKITLKKPGSQRVQEPVFTLDFHPEITPENVQKKLSMYMVFA